MPQPIQEDGGLPPKTEQISKRINLTGMMNLGRKMDDLQVELDGGFLNDKQDSEIRLLQPLG